MVMSKWTKHVTNYFRNMRKTNKNYKFKDAMTDARPSYKKMSGGNQFTVSVEPKKEGETPAAATPETPAATPATSPETPATSPETPPDAAANPAANPTVGGKKSKKTPSRKSMRVNKKGGKKGKKSSKRNGKK